MQTTFPRSRLLLFSVLALLAPMGGIVDGAIPRAIEAPGVMSLGASPYGYIFSVATDRPFYRGGETAMVDVTIRSDAAGAPIFGYLEVYVFPDDDPLGGGTQQEGSPIYSATRVVQQPPSPTGPTEAVEHFLVALTTPSSLYHAAARWQPSGAITFDEPVGIEFGVRPDIPGVPLEILTFAEIAIDVPAVRAALKVGLAPVASGGCIESSGTAPASTSSVLEQPSLTRLETFKRPLINDPGQPVPGDTSGCGWEVRVPPEAVTLPLEGSRSVTLDLAPAQFVSVGVPENVGVEFFRGSVAGAQGTDVRVTVESEGVHVMILDSGGGSTYIEPLAEYVTSSAPDRYIVYRSEAVRPPATVDPGVTSVQGSEAQVLSDASGIVRPESHTTDFDLFRILRLWVYKDNSGLSSLHHIWDLAPIFERDLKIMLEPAFARTVNSDAYDSNDDVEPDCGPFLDGFRNDTAGDDWNFLNLDARILFSDNSDVNYCVGPDGLEWGECTLGCGGPTDGTGTSRTRAAWVWHSGSSHRIQQVAGQELGHALGAGHDCTSAGTEQHCWGCLWGGCVDCYTHNLKTIMCGTYPGDSHSLAQFSASSRTQIRTNADTLPESMHFFSGNSAGGDGLSLTLFQMRHQSAVAGQTGWYKADYRVRNTSGGQLGFWDLHFAFDPDNGAITRAHQTVPFNFPADLEFTHHSGFQEQFPGVGGWCQMEVWPSYRMDDGHRDHFHYGPANWFGLDFEIDAALCF